MLHFDDEPELDPLVVLLVAAALVAVDEPLWFVVACPPLAVLDAGAKTRVFPPLLFPSRATLLPLPTVTGTLTTEPDLAFPPVVLAQFDCVELAFWWVLLLPTTLASAAVAVNTVSDPTMSTPSMPRQMLVRMCVVLLYLELN